MAGARKRGHEEEHENHERWLVSYADMITLLAALFIVLFAMSQIDLEKFREFADQLRERFGGGGTPTVIEPAVDGANPHRNGPVILTLMPEELAAAEAVIAGREESAARAERERMDAAVDSVTRALSAVHLQDAVTFRQEARGLVISVVADDVLFDLGSARIPPLGRALLDVVAPALASLPNEIGIEGHTDDRPVLGGYGTNWELSAARATAVLRYLVEQGGLAPSRIYAAGFADQRPLVPNDSEAHRARNRRVEIVVLSQSSTVARPTAGGGAITAGAMTRQIVDDPIGRPIGDPVLAGLPTMHS
jgi:chemotaxis protein MotB